MLVSKGVKQDSTLGSSQSRELVYREHQPKAPWTPERLQDTRVDMSLRGLSTPKLGEVQVLYHGTDALKLASEDGILSGSLNKRHGDHRESHSLEHPAIFGTVSRRTEHYRNTVGTLSKHLSLNLQPCLCMGRV